MTSRRDVLRAMGGAALIGVAPRLSAQDAYPGRPISIVVPYAAGGGTDLLVRLLQKPMQDALGQPVIVENKAGAAGAIGTRGVARARPDGYTLLASNNGPSVIVPLLSPDAGYDAIADFAPIGTFASAPIVLIAGMQVPAALPEAMQWLREQPQGLAYGTAGVGSLGHLAAEQFASSTGLSLTHVPYRGQAPTVMAVISGEVPLAFTSASDMLTAQVAAGKLRIIGTGNPQVSSLLPDVQPIGSVLEGFRVDFWQGLLAPAGTPPEVVARLSQILRETLQDPAIRQQFQRSSYEVHFTSPEQMAATIAQESRNWRDVIAERGIRAET